MAAAAESLTVAIVRVRTKKRRRKPMLVVGCTDPRFYPLSPAQLDRLKRDFARAFGLDHRHLEELGLEHESFTAVRIPLVGILVEEFDQLAGSTHCRLIEKTREALGLSKPAVQPAQAFAEPHRNPRPPVRRAPSMVH